jgi:lipopolysaccharide transport protein LptA
MCMARSLHNSTQPSGLRQVLPMALMLLCAGSMLVVTATAQEMHIAAVTRNSIPAVSKDQRRLPVDVASSHIDYKGDAVILKDVVVTQGETRVQADRAHATRLDDFDNSHWTFEGNVRIMGEQHGNLRSDQAVVEFHNSRISRATITGTPAEFEQKRADADLTARGRAKEIVYDVSDGTIRLSTDAWLSDGHNEISGPQLVYNIREQAVQAATVPGSDDKVHIRIEPKANEDTQKKP